MENKKYLTEIYNKANKLDMTRHNPITTERIFVAMLAAMEVEREAFVAVCGEYDPTDRYSSVLYIKRAIRKRSNVELRGEAPQARSPARTTG